MAQRLSEQVVEWLTVGGDAFTPQNSSSVPLVVSKPGQTVIIPATNGTAIGIYNNQGQLWTVGAAGATSSVKSSQLIVSSSDAAAGAGAALELWRGTDVSWQLRADNSTDTLIIGNNWTTAAQTSYTANVAFGYGAVANQYVHIYSTLDSNYSYGGASGSALSVAGGATFAKKVYINDTTDSNYATIAGSFVTKGGAYIAKKTYIADATDSNYATLAGALVVAGGANIGKKVYIKDTTDSNYSTVAGSLVTMGGAYIKKKTYIADTTDASSTSTGSFSTAGGVSIAKKLYVGSDFTQTGDTALIKSNVIRFQNKAGNTSQAGTSFPYVTSLLIGDGREATLDEYQDGALAIHSNKGLFLHTTSTPIAVYDATKTYSVGAIVFYNRQYYRCTTAITEAQEWTAANWTSIGTSSGTLKTDATSVVPVVTNTSSLGTSSLRWKSLEIGTASSYGSGTQPIYWNAGVPTASTSTVGSGVKPIYLSSGTITVSSSTVGSGVKPIYLSSGTLTVSSSSLGGTAQPVYMTSGELKALSATVGSGVKPVYLSSGTITVSSSTAGSSTMPVYLSSGEIKQITSYSGDISITETTPTSATTYYMVYVDGTSGARTLRANPHLYYYDNAPAGSSWLNIGNASEYGGLTLWNHGYHVDLRPVSTLSAVRTIEFPNVGGTVVLGSGTANHITYFSGANTVAAAPNITHDNYSLTITDSGGQSPTFRLTGTSADFGLLIGSGNTNKGIYSYTGTKWLLHWDSSDIGHLNSTLIPNANNTFSLGSSSAVWSNLYVNNIYLFRQANAAYGRISFYKPDYKTWIMYMSNAASGACPSGGTPSTLGNVTSWALRSYIENSAGYGWIWESAANSNTGAPTACMALSSNNGQLSVSGNIVLSNADISIQRAGRSKSWYNGRDGAILRLTSVNAYSPFISAKTKNGSWEFAVYDNASYQNQLLFGYVDDTRYSSGSPNAHAAQIRFSANGRIIFSSGQGYGSSTPSGGIAGEVFFKTV